MMLRWLLVVGVLAILAGSSRSPQQAYACHPSGFFDKRVNLDGDRAKEEVIAVDNHDCQHTTFQAYVHIRDHCDGAWQTYDLHSDRQVLEQFKIVNADGWTRRPEVFFVTRSFKNPATDIAEVVRLEDRPSGCARAHALFAYSPKDATVQGFSVELKNAAPQFRGLEVVLTTWDAMKRTVTTFRYDRKHGRYVVYG